MDDLLTDFIAETREMMEAIEGEVIAWEASPSDKSRLDAIFRFVHTVKGNCGFFDFPRLARLSHAAEDTLADVRDGRRVPDQRLVSAILAVIDCIAEMMDAIEAGESFPEGRETALIAALKRADGAEEIEAAPVASSAGSTAAASPRSIRLPVDLLDRVMSGVSDMVLARNDLAHRLQAAGTQPTIDGPFERLTTILNDVRDAITRMRMQRIEQLFGAIPRVVRDLSQELGKQVLIDIEGGDVELDREVIEIIRDPITHIVRNAIDHGIEAPSQRIKAGKRETGLLRIAARQTGNRISIVISDDGKGLDEKQIAYKAISSGMITQARIDQMDSHAIQQLVFEAGLSTAAQVSEISGRGVGMDVVRDNIERVGGWIEVTSTPRQGTAVHLHIPLTLSIIPGVIVECAGQRFALPQSYVEEVEYGFEASLDYSCIGNAKLVTMRGIRTPCLALSEVLNVDSDLAPEEQTYVLLRLAKGDQFALAVDKVHNIGDIVVKPLPPAILELGCYSGTALLDDGKPILLLDLPQIAEENGVADTQRSRIGNLPLEEAGDAEIEPQMVMLFVGLDGARKAARLELVKRIETISSTEIDMTGQHPHTVIDGQILTVAGCDDALLSGGKIRLLRLSDGTSEILYAMSKVIDSVPLDGAPLPSSDDPLSEGLAIIAGQTVTLLNGQALFGAYGAATKLSKAITCNLPDTDWVRTILAPLVASDGYQIVYGETQADIVLTIDENSRAESSSDNASPIIHLQTREHNAASENGPQGASFPYERGALLSALRAVGDSAATPGAKR